MTKSAQNYDRGEAALAAHSNIEHTKLPHGGIVLSTIDGSDIATVGQSLLARVLGNRAAQLAKKPSGSENA